MSLSTMTCRGAVGVVGLWVLPPSMRTVTLRWWMNLKSRRASGVEVPERALKLI